MIREKGVSCYVNEVTLGKHLKMGLMVKRTNHIIRGLELSVPSPPPPLGRGKKLKLG